MVDHILDFCGGCGSLLPEGLGLEPEPRCLNCSSHVKKKEDRIEGVFTDESAIRVARLFYGQ